MGVRPMGRGKSAMWMAGLGRPPNGGHRGLAPAGGHCPCGMRRARWKRKNVSAGRSAQAQTSCRRRGKVGNPARRSETETPGPWGNLQPGEVWDTRCADFRCRWPVVDESLRSGPMRASASTTARAARSEAERAEREAGQMRSCTPTPSAPSATGRQYRPHRRPKRARMPGKIGAGTGTPTPVRAEGHCTGARPAPFSLTPGAARSLFGATKKRMGGALPSWHPS